VLRCIGFNILQSFGAGEAIGAKSTFVGGLEHVKQINDMTFLKTEDITGLPLRIKFAERSRGMRTREVCRACRPHRTLSYS
jgi:hypothetical protein